MVVNTHRLFTQLLPVMRIDAVCDVGSMNGADALRFRAAAPAARIHAFEPNPENLRRMQANPALRDNNINIVPLAVTNYDGDGEFHIIPAGYFPGESWRGMSSLYQRFDQPQLSTIARVKTARLDTFLAHEVSPQLRVALWIDVEGKAHEVIEGGAGLMRQVWVLHIEVETSLCISAQQKFYPQVKALLRSAGFIELATDGEPTQVQFNALFVRSDLPAAVRYRIQLQLLRLRLRRSLGGALRKISPALFDCCRSIWP
jgi:FkbM family methyltransferase